MFLIRFFFYHAGRWEQERAREVGKKLGYGAYTGGPSALLFAFLVPTFFLLGSVVEWGIVVAICLWPVIAFVIPKSADLVRIGRSFSNYSRISKRVARSMLVAWGLMAMTVPLSLLFIDNLALPLIFALLSASLETYLRQTADSPNG